MNLLISRNYQGQEIISRFTSELKSDATFYVDANGRQTVKRVRDYRESFNYTDTSEPIAHNYYPVNSHIYLKDAAKGTHLAILVDRAQGGSSLQDGQLELMVHRRMVLTDFFPEALNETAYGRGLVARGTHWMILNEADDGVKWIRSLSQEMYRSPQITFAPTGLTGREWFYKHRTQVAYRRIRSYHFYQSCSQFLLGLCSVIDLLACFFLFVCFIIIIYFRKSS